MIHHGPPLPEIMQDDTPSPSAPETVDGPKPGLVSRLVSGLLLGLFAGAAALGLDLLLAAITLGEPVPPVEGMGLVYLATGLGFGLVGGLVATLLPRRSAVDAFRGPSGTFTFTFTSAFAFAFAAVYTLPVFERLFDAALVRLRPLLGPGATSQGLAILLGLLGALALFALAHVLGRIARAPTAGLLIAGWVAAAGLAVNRNWVAHPLEPKALLADAAIVGLGFAAAGLARARGPIVLAAVAAGLAAVLAAWIFVGPAPPSPAGAPPMTAEGESPPNLLLLVIDTLRADVFEAVLEQTEEGRAFARHLEDAMLFENAQAAAPWTAPSMGSILTGLYPDEHGFGQLRAERDPNRTLRPLAPHVPTLATRLRQRGYATEAIIANPILYPGSGIDRGFDRYEVLDSTIKKLPLLMVAARLGWMEIADYQPAPRVTARMARRLDALVDGGRPFFLWLQYLDPHEPIVEHPQLGPDPAAQGLDEESRLYRDEVRYTLVHLGRAIELLKERGAWQNSLVILVSDHGEMHPVDGHAAPIRDPETGDFLRRGHGKALYDEIVRVPLVIRPPGALPEEGDDAGQTGPRRIPHLVSHLDLHDTVAEVLGVDIPAIGRDRISLAPYLEPEEPSARRRAWALLGGIQAGIPQRSLVTPKRKLVVYDREKPPELYDLGRDPEEQHNLAKNPKVDLESWVERLEARWAELNALEDDDDGAAELDPETRKRLEALGYLQ